jgi:protein-S-isoprenylcysteine O-methyltransferase Ste14
MNNQKVLPPTYLLIAILAMVLLHFLFPVLKILPSPWNAFGVIFLLIGIVLNLMGSSLFRKVGTTIKPYEESSTLVTDGIFSMSRNPMYLGFVLILTGAAFSIGTLTPFLVIPVFMILMEMVFIKTEEKMLEKKFAQSYMTYKQKVRRWI